MFNIDLVKEQIKICLGERLSISQNQLQPFGHCIELRINAEHPETFIPCPGKIQMLHVPGGPNIRFDSHIYNGYIVGHHYDSMIGKLICKEKQRRSHKTSNNGN